MLNIPNHSFTGNTIMSQSIDKQMFIAPSNGGAIAADAKYQPALNHKYGKRRDVESMLADIALEKELASYEL